MGLVNYYRRGATHGYRGSHYACSVDSFSIPLDPIKSVKLLRNSGMEVNEIAKSLILSWMEDYLPHYDNSISDEELSFSVAKIEVEKGLEEDSEPYNTMIAQFGNYPSFATLAWHYFYGIGCERNIEEARKLMKWTCTKEGEYMYPALQKLIKDMGLDSELKYNPDLNENEKYL